MTYLLKLTVLKAMFFTYIGNVIHKMIEEKTKFGNYDLEKIMMEFNFPPEEIYKFPNFSRNIDGNIRIIEGVITDFENSTAFKKTLVEEKINLPIDNNLNLPVGLTKILIDELFIIIFLSSIISIWRWKLQSFRQRNRLWFTVVHFIWWLSIN